MKKQNIIIFGVFVLVLIVFYLVSCTVKESEEATTINLTEDITEDKVVKKYVDIVLSGELERTGLYNVPASWTLRMLFDYAGVTESGDISEFTLTDLVTDGMTYNVPKMTTLQENKLIININTATVSELIKIPGIGEVLANRIIAYRESKLFSSVEDIKKVSGIGDAMYEKIKDYITV